MKEKFQKYFPDSKFTKLKNVVKRLHNGENVNKDDYSEKPTKYRYLSVTGIKRNGIVWGKTLWLKNDVGKKIESSKLNDKNLIVGRSGTYVGLTAVFNKKETGKTNVIPSGYTMVIELDLEKVDPKFVSVYLNSPKVQEFLIAASTEKNQRNLPQGYLLEAPFPKLSKKKQEPLVKKLKELDKERKKLSEKLQQIDSLEENVIWSTKVLKKQN